MTDRLKYVVIMSQFGCEVPVIFPALLEHQTVATKVISAGFISIYPQGDGFDVACWGKSVSLGIISRGDEDAALIKRELEKPNQY